MNPLNNLLLNYTPSDAKQDLYKKKMLDFLNMHPDCFERTCKTGHFTASCFLVNKQNSKFLLMLHRKLNIWLQPGGHCDGDEDVLRVAIKEAVEETGIINIEPISSEIFDIDIHLIPKRGEEPEHYHYDIRFMLQVKSDENYVLNHESKDMNWFCADVDSMPTCDESVIRMFNKWKEKQSSQVY